MMYQDRFVVAIKNNGRVLREHGDTTYLPFGCEYSILLKNKNTVRALVRVEIDGKDATGGIQLIVPANGSIDLKRFIEDGNFERGHKFKFIERTKKIEDGPRGIQAEDGLIRVEFEFEREPAKIVHHDQHVYHTYDHYPWYRHQLWNGYPYATTSLLSSTSGVAGSVVTASCGANSAGVRGVSGDTVKLGSVNAADMGEMTCSASFSAGESGSVNAFVNQISPTMDSFAIPQNAAEPKSEVGITVAGGVSDQKFTQGAWFPVDGQKHVMILKLLGQVGDVKVEKPVTVKTKTECPTCGHKNAFGTKFCSECGTGLSLL